MTKKVSQSIGRTRVKFKSYNRVILTVTVVPFESVVTVMAVVTFLTIVTVVAVVKVVIVVTFVIKKQFLQINKIAKKSFQKKKKK